MKSTQKLKIKPKLPSKRKNVSQKIKNGTVLRTRDEFFIDNNNFIKPEYRGTTTLYRGAVVIDSNRNNELAVIKEQSKGTKEVVNKSGGKEYYHPFIKTKDDEGKPIKVGSKFVRGNPKYDIPLDSANKMKKISLKETSKKLSKQNQNALRELKGRKK